MSESSTESPPDIETWTKEDVQHWLLTEVKVDQSCADTFMKEDVSGRYLVDFEKRELLGIGIKHGPAVKITSHLKRLKEGSQFEPQSPADVESWTKEEVARWLLQSVKVDDKKAERFKEEDVSGDCLVCFDKQDFLDLELKKGPAVKIMKELDRLKKEESPPQPVSRPFRWSLRAKNKQESKKIKAQLQETKWRETAESPAPLIKTTLDKLSTDDRRSFYFQLRYYTESGCKPIPWGKLEGKDTTDVATLVTDHYGHDEALHITKKILQRMSQRQLVSQLDGNTDQEKLRYKCCDEEEDTEDTVKSDSSSCSRCKHKKTQERNSFSFNMNVKMTLPCCK
ncbi:uncharacterized protein LOC121941070 [Plectropomus leopardus]|uniref:uncharacterized protein LOC121941070 n=1 Tax=Plectropomus leopardus TaxID=160734 RepID=UPI001C4B9AB7|nr:uncharacterized protein LOC121941070 [Plectropomus leopardus]